VDAHYNLGAAYTLLQRGEEAIAAYQEALRLQPDFAPAVHNLVVCYRVLGNESAMREYYQRLRELDPDLAAQLAAKIKADGGLQVT